MVTINDCVYSNKSNSNSLTSDIAVKQQAKELHMNGIKRSLGAGCSSSSANGSCSVDEGDDVPLLVSDNEDGSDCESCSSRSDSFSEQSSKPVDAESVKRDMKEESLKGSDEEKENEDAGKHKEASSKPSGAALMIADSTANAVSANATTTSSTKAFKPKTINLTKSQFLNERTQLMTIVVKYFATKINNSFPPESTKHTHSKEIPLDKFLLILTSRLNLSLNLFMQGMVYLFRYMDIVYLLRYLNQSNNFANYNEMQFSVKKLIIGCFRITLKNNHIKNLNWSSITGLHDDEINRVMGVITTRMNGKLSIKQIELVKMKSEIFRFVKMVTQPI